MADTLEIDALWEVISLLEPLYSKHTRQDIQCEGCLFEYEEALTIAMNVVSGLDAHAHMSPPHTQEQAHPLDQPCDACQVWLAGQPQREDAWRQAGFEEVDGEWRLNRNRARAAE